MQTSADITSFAGVLTGFVETRTGVREAMVVSPDGLLLASSFNEVQGDVEHIAAISAGLTTLTQWGGGLLRLHQACGRWWWSSTPTT